MGVTMSQSVNLNQIIQESVIPGALGEIEVGGIPYKVVDNLHNQIVNYHRRIEVPTRRDEKYNLAAERRIAKKNYKDISTGDMILDLIRDCFYESDGIKVSAEKVIEGIFIEKFDCQYSSLAVILDILAEQNHAKWSINYEGFLCFW